MTYRFPLATLALLALIGCGGGSASVAPGTPASIQRVYNGTASVGDFLTITVDAAAHTIAYTNHSNGDAGTVPYAVNADGTYSLSDPTGNLISAYEVPNYALIVQAAKTGPNHNTPALVTAVESGQISMATFGNRSYNYMQFRTSSGGIEVGSVSIDSGGSVSGVGYWPFGAVNGSGAFNLLHGISGAGIVADPSGTFLKVPDQGGFDYIFGTANGQFAVDTGNGAILGFQKAAAKAFDPNVAGTYSAIYYQKNNANTGQGNIESGTGTLSNATIVIDAAGGITVNDSHGAPVVHATLTPVADASYLVGPGKLSDPCFGMFTFRITAGGTQQDVFMTFQGRALLFSAYKSASPASPGNPYSYIYGVGLH